MASLRDGPARRQITARSCCRAGMQTLGFGFAATAPNRPAVDFPCATSKPSRMAMGCLPLTGECAPHCYAHDANRWLVYVVGKFCLSALAIFLEDRDQLRFRDVIRDAVACR